MVGLIIMVVGIGGIISSTILEWKRKEPIYALLMKIFPAIFAVGCAIYWFPQ